MFNSIEIKDVKEEIGQLIKVVRKSKKLTQVEIADSLDVSKNTIQNLESGKNFTANTFFKVLKEFDLLERLYDEILKTKKEIDETKSLY